MPTNTISETRYDTNNFWKENLNPLGIVTSGTLTWTEILDSTSVKTTGINSSTLSSGSAGPIPEALDGDTASYTIQRGTKVDEEFFESPEQFIREETGTYTAWYVGNNPMLNTWFVSVSHNGKLIAMTPLTNGNLTKSQAYAIPELLYGDNTGIKAVGEPITLKKGTLIVDHSSSTGEGEFALIQKYPTSRTYEIILNGTSETADPPVATPPPPANTPPTPVVTVPDTSNMTSRFTDAEDLRTAQMNNNVLSVEIAKSAATIQDLRSKVIQNAIIFARELRLHQFYKLGEIVRVCTALGVERAYTRGLQHTIESEEQIDRYIQRFDLRGVVPFVKYQSEANPEIIAEGKIFFKPSNTTIMFFCTTIKDDVFVKVTNNVADCVVDGSIDIKQIEETYVDTQELPDFVIIPKYQKEHMVNGYNYICELLNNKFTGENLQCITTMEISDPSLPKDQRPEPNTLIPINNNTFPYVTPGSSLSYGKRVFPEPVRIQTVLDGTPLETEQLVLANRFELTGTVEIEPGVDITVDMTPDDVNGGTIIQTDPPDLPPGQIQIGDRVFPNLPRIAEVFEWHGPGLFILDPVKGEATLFEKELFENDIIEIKRDEKIIGGKFITVGTDYLYYAGQEFIERYNRTEGEIQVNINNVIYTLKEDSSNQSELGQVHELKNIRQIQEYNARYKIKRESYKSEEAETNRKKALVESKTFSNVNFIGDVINDYSGELDFSSSNLGGKKLSEIFEPGEGFTVDKIQDEDKNDVTNVYISFSKISDEEKKLKGCFAYFRDNVNKRMKIFSTNGITVTRAAKDSEYMMDFGSATALPSYTYHKVTKIVSDTEIEISPEAKDSFSGKISRIGFCAYSQSASPSLLKEGLGPNGGNGYEVKFKKNESVNVYSDKFFMPEARTNKVVLYKSAEISKAPSAKIAVEKYGMTVYSHTEFPAANLGKPLKETDIEADKLNETIVGTLFFTDKSQVSSFITLESIDNDFKSVPHGFSEDDSLRLYRFTTATGDYKMVNGNTISSTASADATNFHPCGALLQVIEVKSPNRFEIDYDADLSAWFEAEQLKKDTHIRATNGGTTEFWEKYFARVHFDGTTDYTGSPTEVSTETLYLNSKVQTSNTTANYWSTKIEGLKVGTTPIKITNDPENKGGYSISVNNTGDADAFILTLRDSEKLNNPPSLMHTFPLRSAKFIRD